MHTATQLDDDCFEIDGGSSTVDGIVDWHRGDRFGLVVNEPLGALGASMLIQTVVTAFWNEFRRSDAWPPAYGEIYPDMMVFHVGQGWGELGGFDFWPEDREQVVDPNPADLLGAIGRHAITHLAVPDGNPLDHDHRAPHLGPVQRRLRHGFVYSPEGRVRDANLTIHAKDVRILENIWTTLHPSEALVDGEEEFGGTQEFDVYAALSRRRMNEVSDEQRQAVALSRERLNVDGLPLETYRVSTPAETLSILNGAGVTFNRT